MENWVQNQLEQMFLCISVVQLTRYLEPVIDIFLNPYTLAERIEKCVNPRWGCFEKQWNL